MTGKFPHNVFFSGKQKRKVPMKKQTPKLSWQPPVEEWIRNKCRWKLLPPSSNISHFRVFRTDYDCVERTLLPLIIKP